MLKENIKTLRKHKGLSQEELSIKLNVVRQTISKWEQGLSVPDSEMLISISEVFEIPVSTLLGETISETKDDDLKVISEKLEIINYQLSQQQKLKRKKTQCLLIALSIIIIITFVILFLLDSPYLNWDYSEPENAVLGVTFHTFEWIFVRIALIVFISSIVGIVIIQKKK
ncbi:MAG: helix-turn-helix transcriptional regulator [Bacilli bacterium]|nr:helix-turn-helix transcriptional regulator [Bacilli bacterium]MDD4608296.1 helix-turn-helix transcriptional regulator [Bacilli bacterium]